MSTPFCRREPQQVIGGGNSLSVSPRVGGLDTTRSRAHEKAIATHVEKGSLPTDPRLPPPTFKNHHRHRHRHHHNRCARSAVAARTLAATPRVKWSLPARQRRRRRRGCFRSWEAFLRAHVPSSRRTPDGTFPNEPVNRCGPVSVVLPVK